MIGIQWFKLVLPITALFLENQIKGPSGNESHQSMLIINHPSQYNSCFVKNISSNITLKYLQI
jgi:hypothetical protein